MGQGFYPIRGLEFQTLLDEGENLVHGQTNLLHGITEADGYAAIFLALEVVGDAERSTDLIFTRYRLPMVPASS